MQIAEIFESIHGEVNGHHQGRICTFIRTGGCNLKCSYCDTPKTQDPANSKNLSQASILDQVMLFGNRYACITGGEPLIRNNILFLLQNLWENHFKVSVETNGTVDISPFFRYVESFVVDYKLESSHAMVISNFKKLRKTDVIKFVIGSKDDFFKAQSFLRNINTEAIIAFSAMQPNMPHETLAKLLLKYKIDNALLSIQLHKIINMP